MRIAGERTISEWPDASKMPPLAFILERTSNPPEIIQDRALLSRADKPTDWARIGRGIGVSPEEIQDWLEGGKIAQQEYIAKLEQDPEWRKMADRLGATPGLVKRESVTIEPTARGAWATKKAKENGWME